MEGYATLQRQEDHKKHVSSYDKATSLLSFGYIQVQSERKGFDHVKGIGYTKTFSLVAKPITIRIFVTLALSNCQSMGKLHIYNAFLKGNLDEEVYMIQQASWNTLILHNMFVS